VHADTLFLNAGSTYATNRCVRNLKSLPNFRANCSVLSTHFRSLRLLFVAWHVSVNWWYQDRAPLRWPLLASLRSANGVHFNPRGAHEVQFNYLFSVVFSLTYLYLLCRDPQFKEMLELLAMLKKGHCDGLKVRLGRLQNLISSSCIGILVLDVAIKLESTL